MITLGLDIGTNSVGSAWIDTENKTIQLGCSVFPAGVEDSDTKRGAPKNQVRREKRGQRRNLFRRAKRKHQLRKFLVPKGWMPSEHEQNQWLSLNPWKLRKEGLDRQLTPYEFGRVLLHIAQRRGAFGKDAESNDNNSEEGKIKEAIDHTHQEMQKAGSRTFGEFIADLYELRKIQVGRKDKTIYQPIRNRTNAAKEAIYEFCADRNLIVDEFQQIWKVQKSFSGKLSSQLTETCKQELYNPQTDSTWRHQGLLFGQRNTYWNMGSMGRCDLEPTDQRCPKADMYAQEFLVLETINNIRIIPPGETERKLNDTEREKVIEALQTQKTATVATVRKALGIHRGEKKTLYTLNLDADPKRGLNTNWFQREIVTGAIGKERWNQLTQKEKDSINRALLKYEPDQKEHLEKLKNGCMQWWNFTQSQAEKLIQAWEKRPKTENRVSYSRKAIRNLLPYLQNGYSVNEARQLFAEDASNHASDEQRQRYTLKASHRNKAIRHFLDKHPDLLPPAPTMLNNPVVRKAIHEVRRHIQAYIRIYGKKPDRIIIELTRQAKQTAKVRNEMLSRNRKREQERKAILIEHQLEGLPHTQQRKAITRVLLCREQKFSSAYSDRPITERMAAIGDGLEVDHIVPKSKGGPDALVNRVLCYKAENLGKGNKTLREWLDNEEFEKVEQRFRHLKKDNPGKWEYIHKDVKDLEGFTNSQLTDTAYAARQVTQWLRDVLYDGELDGRRIVYHTKGSYTSILRRDWGLFPDDTVPLKNRADHRHHALDAVAIAMSGPERLGQLAKAYEQQETEYAETGHFMKRQSISPPWGTQEEFRADVMKQYGKLIVAHRPVKRKITESFHDENPYGPVWNEETKGIEEKLCTRKIYAADLNPNHLRVPDYWERLREKLQHAETEAAKRAIRQQMLAGKDVKPGKPGIVRDRWFREELRECLRQGGINPDRFNDKEIKKMIKMQGLTLQSGVPVRRITLLRAPTVIPIQRKKWDLYTNRMVYETEPKSIRLYEPQNNHHIEIRENKNGKWIAEVIRNYDAAKAVREKSKQGQNNSYPTAVNRKDTEMGKFIMSLAIGEMVFMKHPETQIPGYFVVFKIDGTGAIHFTPHYDAGRSKETDTSPAREDLKLPVSKMQALGLQREKEPQKIWISPLGEIKLLIRD